jgi:hypothetical protein
MTNEQRITNKFIEEGYRCIKYIESENDRFTFWAEAGQVKIFHRVIARGNADLLEIYAPIVTSNLMNDTLNSISAPNPQQEISTLKDKLQKLEAEKLQALKQRTKFKEELKKIKPCQHCGNQRIVCDCCEKFAHIVD